MEECIAAIATALSPAGLGVIRLSGRDCIKIAANFFKSSKSIEKLKGYEATYGKILDGDWFIHMFLNILEYIQNPLAKNQIEVL